MGGKSGKALLNTLFVSDIRINFRKNGKLRPVVGGNVKPGLTHQRKQTDSFQRNRFTAGIGSRNYQKVKIPAQMNIDGNHLFFVKKGMAALAYMNKMFSVKNGSRGV